MSFDPAFFPRLMARGTRWCLDHGWATFAVTVLALLLSGVAARQIAVDPSPEAYLHGGERWAEFDRIDHTYGIGETIVIGLREAGGTVFDAETVRSVAELDRIVSALPGVKRVLSVASASVIGDVGVQAQQADVIDVGRLLPEGPITAESAATLGARIARHKVYPRVLVDPRHETTFLLVQLDAEAASGVSRLELTREIRAQADRFRTQARTVHLAGPPMTKEAIASGVEHDALAFFPATVLILFVLTWLMFGDPLAALIPIGVVSASSFLVVGVISVFGVPLNMATVVVPIVILVVGIADSVHLLAELRRQFARTGDRESALVATVEAVALPCLITSATSAAGFLALLSSRIAPLRQFGAATAAGLMVAYFASMLLTPVLLSWVRYPKDTSRIFAAAPRMGRALTNFAIRTGRNALVPIATTGLLTGASLAALTQLEINSDFVGYLSAQHRLRQDMETIGHSLGGSDTLEVILHAPRAGDFKHPEMLARADRAADAIRGIEGVRGVLSFVDYLKLANSLLDTERGFAIPSSPNAVSQVLLLEAEGFPALATPDLSEIRMSLQVPNMPSASVRALAARVEAVAVDALGDAGVRVTVTGIPLLFADVVRFVVDDAVGSFGLVVVMIWLSLIIGFRSVSLATVSMVPNLLPVGLTFATMAVVGVPFDTISAFVACLGIGIAVDDTVHIVARYQKAREMGSPTQTRALRYALTHAGHPVILTSILLAAGFGVLTVSAFVPTVRVGALGALLVGYAAVFDLCFLPALLIAADRIGAHFEPDVLTKPSSLTGSFEEAASHLTSPPGPAEPPEASEDEPAPPPKSRIRLRSV
jgi:predicted RND superfamily exporter protein